MSRPKRREREIEQTRSHIVEAAARVFSRKTFAEASMAEIAQEAGFSAASLYSYFEGKLAIIKAFAENLRQESDDILQRPLPTSLDFRQRLELMLMWQCQWVEAHQHDFMMLAREERFREALDELRDCDETAQVAGLVAWMQEHARPGDLGTSDPEEAAWLLWGIMRGGIARWMYGARQAPLTGQVGRLLDLFLFGLLGASQSDPSTRNGGKG